MEDQKVIETETLTLKNELVISEHLKSGWRNFSLQQLEQSEKLGKQMFKYKEALEIISNFMENWEDYYGGVGINYHEMINSIINVAKTALKEE